MKHLISAAALALLMQIAAPAHLAFATDGKVVRLGTEGAYAPWNFINDKGEIDGFERELGDELCTRAKLMCNWVTNEWKSIIPNLVSGNYDAIVAGMSITEEREKLIDFTQAYTPPDPSLFAGLNDSVDFKTGVIAAQTGTIQANHIATQGAVLVEFATPDETIAAVMNGEADAVLGDASFIKTAVEANAGLMVVGDPVSLGNGVGMGLRESDTELRTKFDAAIQSMKDDNSLNKLIMKWEVSTQW